jgi:hypothetical protein
MEVHSFYGMDKKIVTFEYIVLSQLVTAMYESITAMYMDDRKRGV